MSTPARSTTRADANTEEAKALVRRWFGEAMNSGRAATARAVSEEVFAEGFVDHDGPDGGARDRVHWQAAVVDAVFAAFSEVEVRIEHLLAENDLVAQLAHPRTRREFCRLVTFTMGGRAARDGGRAFRR